MAVAMPTVAVVDAEEEDAGALAERRSEGFVRLRWDDSLPGSPLFGCHTAPKRIHATALGHKVPGV